MSYSSEIVIGIDFGTTYSGVSWAVNGGAKTIRLITNWPNPSGGKNPNSEKTPSVIAYERGTPTKWGYDVNERDQSFRWIKILLEPESDYSGKSEQVKKSNELLEQLNTQAVTVVADYLGKLWEYTMKDIERRQGPSFKDDYKLKVVMSVPAMWTPAAKERTLQAAKKAGLGELISLVTEPEAAALATLKERAETSQLKPGDCFVVCDAGGGTVDLISYEVQGIEPLIIKECAIGTGGLCGSAYLDMGFQKWICQKIGQSQWNRLKDAAKRRMVNDFEYAIKRNFDPSTRDEYTVDLRGVEDDPAAGIRDDNITVKSVILTIFDHICGQIKNLVAQQISQVKEKGKKIKAILLVGGFGESGYLHDQLKDAHTHEDIVVLQVNGAWSAICRGATMWGLEHSDHFATTGDAPPQKTVAARLARYSYGVKLALPFDESKHRMVDRIWSEPDQAWYAANQMQWLIKRGEEFEDGQFLWTPVTHSLEGISSLLGVFSERLRPFENSLWFSDEDTPPQSAKSNALKKLCEVSFEVKEQDIWVIARSFKVNGRKYRNVTFTIAIQLGNANLDFAVICGEQLCAHSEAKYPDS